MSHQAYAISGNTQISLAGNGKFDELAGGVEAMIGKEPMKTADWYALCFAYSRIKRYDKIMGCLDELDKKMTGSDKRTRLFGLDDGTASAFVMRAEAHIELSEFALAIAQADKALAWYKQENSDDKDIFINALAAKGLALLALGKRADAQRVAQELSNFQLGLFGKEFTPAKSLAMARLNMALGNWQTVLDALDEDKTIGIRSFLDKLASGAFLRGVNNWVWIELPRGFMQTKAKFELGQVDEAKQGYDKLLAVPQVAANGDVYWLALFDRGRLAVQQNELELAEQLFKRAATVIERQRVTINSEANKIGFVGDKQAVYAQLVAAQFKLSKFGDAFESMERGKSRALVDLLATRQVELAPKGNALQALSVMAQIQQTDVESRQQSEAMIVDTVQANANASNGINTSVPAKSKSKQLVDQLPSALASLVSVGQLGVKEAQTLIAPDEALLVYFGEGAQLYATLVQASGVQGHPINATTLEADVRRLRKDMQESLPGVLPQLQALHTMLIAPFAKEIKAKRLTIVPHGALHYVPFAALSDGQTVLIDQYILRTLPSAAVLKLLRPTTSQKVDRMLVLGNPDLENPKFDLPGAHVEAQTLAVQFNADHLLLRKAASRKAFLDLAPKANYIHVASHGQFNAANPLRSGLFLASDTPGGTIESGRVTVSDLYGMNLNADLVTLSACETGLGQIANGDDIVGLTRGFLYAGASTVVASLWQVDDKATAFLMQRMYEHIQQGNRREALRIAQQETRVQYPHPYNWAAFYLTGLN